MEIEGISSCYGDSKLLAHRVYGIVRGLGRATLRWLGQIVSSTPFPR